MNREIDNLKLLLKKQVKGTATPKELAYLKMMRRLYEEDEWDSALIAAISELHDEGGLPEPKVPPPDFAEMAKELRRRRRADFWIRRFRSLGAAVAILFAGTILLMWVQRSNNGDRRPYYCMNVSAGAEIPLGDFQVSLSDGRSAPIFFGELTAGEQLDMGCLRIRRQQSGQFLLEMIDRGVADADTTWLLETLAQTHAEVLLPDGTAIRLNAGSKLSYQPPRRHQGVARVCLEGEAWVRMAEKTDGRQFVLETNNAVLKAREGEFAVETMDGYTAVSLLAGNLLAESRHQGRALPLERVGQRVQLRSIRQMDQSYRDAWQSEQQQRAEEAIAWIYQLRDYRGKSARRYVIDMARWFDLDIKNIHCISERLRMNKLFCYGAPLLDVHLAVQGLGLRMVQVDGVYSFCEPEEGQGNWNFLYSARPFSPFND